MGKLIPFPFARVARRRRQAALAFDAFGELQLVERAQLKLLGTCAGVATLLLLGLQLSLR